MYVASSVWDLRRRGREFPEMLTYLGTQTIAHGPAVWKREISIPENESETNK